MDWITGLVFALMIPFLLVPVLFTWYLTASGLGKLVLGENRERQVALLCRIDADCPEGYVCIGGRCVAQS